MYCFRGFAASTITFQLNISFNPVAAFGLFLLSFFSCNYRCDMMATRVDSGDNDTIIAISSRLKSKRVSDRKGALNSKWNVSLDLRPMFLSR